MPVGVTLSEEPPVVRLALTAMDRVDLPKESPIRIGTRQAPNRLNWLPWAGAAVGGTLVGIGVADEEDLVFTGKLMWIGSGAPAGAATGWLIAKLAR